MNTSVRSAFQAVRDAVRTQLWPIPVLGIVLAVLGGIFIPLADVRVDGHLPSVLDTLIFSGDAGAARTVLSAVSSSLINVTSLTFSLTVVTLQLASSQFSPRLLRTFTQDLFVQVTLAIFLATFTFSLTVLRSVRSSQESASPFVPRIAVTTSFLLGLASVVSLVLFLAHLTRQIRVETMVKRVHSDASSTMTNNLLPRSSDEAPQEIPKAPGDAVLLWAAESGFLAGLSQGELVDAARDADAIIAVDRYPGTFVVAGTPVGRVWPVGGERIKAVALDDLRTKVSGALYLGPERTAGQDVGYGIRQITDIVNKALSPGVNDPTTAVHSLGHSAALLAKLTDYEMGPLVLTDADDAARVVLDRPDFDHYLELAVDQPRSYGASDPQVMSQLYELLTAVSWHVRADQRACVVDQRRRLDATVEAQDFDDVQVARLKSLSAGVLAVLDRVDRPPQVERGT